MKTQLEFTLQGSIVPVTIKGTDDKVMSYELREMTAASRDRYLDLLGNRLRVDSDGKPIGVKKFEGMQSELLALCLWDREQNRYVSKDDLQKWPSSVVSAIYAEAQAMHRLPTAEEEAAKND